jgi:hypothetical protein
MQVVQTDSLLGAINKVKDMNPQIIFVKTYNEARMVVQKLPGTVAWWSRASEEEKNLALQHLETGGTLVSTYGLSVGLNLKVGGKCVDKIALFGCPWSLSALVQAASRIREGGTAFVVGWDLMHTAQSGVIPAQKEVAALLVSGLIDEIFDAFGTAETVPKSVASAKPLPKYQDCRADALIVQGLLLEGIFDGCILCGGSDHHETKCEIVRGLCFTCGFTGHPSKSCPLAIAVPACPATGFCVRCKLPTFKVAGVAVHSESIGMECTYTVLAQQVKFMLLCGRMRGVEFGPSSYFERLRWVMEGSPPNIIAIISRASQAKKPVLALSPSFLSPDQIHRIRVNREAALQRRMTSSPGPSQTLSSLVLSSSVTDASTPPTTQRTRSLPTTRIGHVVRPFLHSHTTVTISIATESSAQQVLNSLECAVHMLKNSLASRLPTVSIPPDRCVRCAGAIHAGACSERSINQVMYDAGCCACCALPVRCVQQSW